MCNKLKKAFGQIGTINVLSPGRAVYVYRNKNNTYISYGSTYKALE